MSGGLSSGGGLFGGPVFSALAGLASGLVAGKLFGDTKTKKVAPPTVAPVTAMPDPLAQKQAQRRKATIASQSQLSAANTVLAGEDKLGA